MATKKSKKPAPPPAQRPGVTKYGADTKFDPGNKAAHGGKREGAGRKKAEITELHAELFNEEHARSAALRLHQLVLAADLDAIKYTLDRIFGKTKQSMDLNVSGLSLVPMIDGSVAAAIAELAKAGGRADDKSE